jgi:hypothetical protein
MMSFRFAAALACIVCTTVVAQDSRPAVRASIDDLAWLAGDWSMSDGARQIEERWISPAGGAMLAVSRTVRGGRMVEFEFLRIVQQADRLAYIAQPGGRPPTEFVLTELTNRRATFENPAHDFPKMIQYTLRPDGTLEARVSDGAQKAQTFTFTRKSGSPFSDSHDQAERDLVDETNDGREHHDRRRHHAARAVGRHPSAVGAVAGQYGARAATSHRVPATAIDAAHSGKRPARSLEA